MRLTCGNDDVEVAVEWIVVVLVMLDVAPHATRWRVAHPAPRFALFETSPAVKKVQVEVCPGVCDISVRFEK